MKSQKWFGHTVVFAISLQPGVFCMCVWSKQGRPLSAWKKERLIAGYFVIDNIVIFKIASRRSFGLGESVCVVSFLFLSLLQ